jgi:hypothetical protein
MAAGLGAIPCNDGEEWIQSTAILTGDGTRIYASGKGPSPLLLSSENFRFVLREVGGAGCVLLHDSQPSLFSGASVELRPPAVAFRHIDCAPKRCLPSGWLSSFFFFFSLFPRPLLVPDSLIRQWGDPSSCCIPGRRTNTQLAAISSFYTEGAAALRSSHLFASSVSSRKRRQLPGADPGARR